MDIKFMRSKLKLVHSILWNIWEREELDATSMALKMEVLDLADDVDDTIVDFILTLERSHNNKRLVQTKIKASPFQDFKKRASIVSRRCRSNWKKDKPFSGLLPCGNIATDDFHPGKPRAYPFVRKDASELMGMAEPTDKLIRHLVGRYKRRPVEPQLKMASIVGMAGMGKTTLANLVYEAIGRKFQSRAFVSVIPGGNMREVLAGILEQVAPSSSVSLAGTQASMEEHLIDIISNFLKDKRYLVIIDDVWNQREWEVIMKSLPENNLGSRIVGTTRITAVAKKWRNDSDDPTVSVREKKSLIHEMHPKWYGEEGWVYKIGEENIVSLMIAMKADLVMDGFDEKHPIVRMCGGTPLAVGCMLSAVTHEREKQAQQGVHAKACDVQDEIEKHIWENGIQNTPGFEPLVESLQLGFDDLPHHMLKTCLLYCSVYPDGHLFEKDNLVRRLICEGFVYNEEKAKSYFKELVNRRLILRVSERQRVPRMHPMMRSFLRWKSREANFVICSSEITSSYNNTCRIRRLYIDNSPCKSRDAAAEDPLSALDWSRIRSLVVFEGIERVPFEKLEGVRVLDLCRIKSLMDHHLKDICGLVRLRHLLGLNIGDAISELPPEIVRLKCLETFQVSGSGSEAVPVFIGSLQQVKTMEVGGLTIKQVPSETVVESFGPCGEGFARLPGFIGNLQQLKTLDMHSSSIRELPNEMWSMQQLKTIDMSDTWIKELPKEIGGLQQLKTLDISHTKIESLPKEIGGLQQLKTLDMSHTQIKLLPKEIGELQQLETLDISFTWIIELPREFVELQQLKTLDISNTQMMVVPKEIWKLAHLKHLRMVFTIVKKIPREIGGLKELKTFKFSNRIVALPLEVCALVELPECIHQALNKNGLVSKLAGEMLSFQVSGGLVVGAKQMHIPTWIKEHFNDIVLLDIRICKLEEQGLKILREMPHLRDLTLRFEVVPREPLVISNEGFAMLTSLTVDSRVPRLTFLEGAMSMLQELTFQFQFYSGPPNNDPVGINHLWSLLEINFTCNKDWYEGGHSPCILPIIEVVKKEALELPSLHTFEVCGFDQDIRKRRSGRRFFGGLSLNSESETWHLNREGEIVENIQA